MIYLFKKNKQEKLLLTSDVEKIVTVKERHYWKFIKQILFLLNYILFIIKICQMCKIKSHWMFSVVFFMFYICVICDCVCVLKYAIYLIWPRQFSFGPDSSHLAHVFLIWLIPWPEQKMSQRGPCLGAVVSEKSLRQIYLCITLEWEKETWKKKAKINHRILVFFLTIYLATLKVYTTFEDSGCNRSWEFCDKKFQWRERKIDK